MPRILFINAPFGPFFGELAKALENEGNTVFRTVSDGGEYFFTPRRNRIFFNPKRMEWRSVVSTIMREHSIDIIITFNDCQPRAREALALAEELHLQRYVIENGYLRPFWVTLDRNGVNGHSQLPSDPQFYLDRPRPEPGHESFEGRAIRHVINLLRHYAMCVILLPVIGFDPRQFGVSIWVQMAGYIKEWIWRKTHSEQGKLRFMENARQQKRLVFSCILQKSGDAQLVVHSPYGSNEPFIREVIASFARRAPNDSLLLIKQHPLDYVTSQTLVSEVARQMGLEDRVLYLRNVPMDAVLDGCNGIITVNSTAGLAAVVQGIPTIALGKAIFNMAGMTFQSGLDEFWLEKTAPDREVVTAFISYLKHTSQINGGFHSPAGRKLLVPRMARAIVNGVNV